MPELSAAVAVITHSPAFIADTNPDWSTIATFSSLEDQIIVLSVALSGRIEVFNCILSPSSQSHLLRLIDIEWTFTGKTEI